MQTGKKKPKSEALQLANKESNQLTKDCICTALLSLMAEEMFDDITVTSIINKAGVSKGGFYRNYKSKEEVLQEICVGLFDYIMQFLSTHNFYENPRQWYIDLFRNIAENAGAYQLLIKAQVPKSLILKFDEERILQEFQRDDNVLEHYRGIAIGKALTEVAVIWFQDGMKETPEEMADIMIKIFFIEN